MSQRRACAVIGADRTSVRYRSRRPDDRAHPCSPAGAGCGAPALRLSPPAYPAWPGGNADEPQEAAAALCRGTAPGATPRRAQAGARHQGADDDPARSEPALVDGLRERHADRQPAVPNPRRGGRLQPGMPLPGGRYLAIGHSRRA